MHIALIVFGDKTHTDLHGTLLVTPVIFTLTLFNRAATNNPRFWRPFASIPNLSHIKENSDKTKPSTKCMDEHKCLALVFDELCKLNRSKEGIKMKLNGHCVIGQV